MSDGFDPEMYLAAERGIAVARARLDGLKEGRHIFLTGGSASWSLVRADKEIRAQATTLVNLEAAFSRIAKPAGDPCKYPMQRCGACHKRWIELQRPVWPSRFHACPYCGVVWADQPLRHEVGEYHVAVPLGSNAKGFPRSLNTREAL